MKRPNANFYKNWVIAFWFVRCRQTDIQKLIEAIFLIFLREFSKNSQFLATCQAENHDSTSIQRLGYRLNNRGNVVLFPVWERNLFSFSIRSDRFWNPPWIILITPGSLYQERYSWPPIVEGNSGWSHTTITAIYIHGNSSFGCLMVFYAQLSVAVRSKWHAKPLFPCERLTHYNLYSKIVVLLYFV